MLVQASRPLPPVMVKTRKVTLNLVYCLELLQKNNSTKKFFLTYLEVKLAALMLKNVAFDSAATALALREEVKAVMALMTLKTIRSCMQI